MCPWSEAMKLVSWNLKLGYLASESMLLTVFYIWGQRTCSAQAQM